MAGEQQVDAGHRGSDEMGDVVRRTVRQMWVATRCRAWRAVAAWQCLQGASSAIARCRAQQGVMGCQWLQVEAVGCEEKQGKSLPPDPPARQVVDGKQRRGGVRGAGW